MRLYSVQPFSVWNDLSQGKIVTAQPFGREPEDDDTSWRSSYEWMASQMESRHVAFFNNESRPEFPMWAWHWYNGHRNPRPDLRHTSMRQWSTTQRLVLLTIDIDEARVQLSNYDGWHWCLNYNFLGKARKTNALDSEVKRVLKTSSYRSNPLPDPKYDARIRESWCQIFDLPTMRSIMNAPKRTQTVQATFWHLAKQDVTSAVEFGLNRASTSVNFTEHPYLQNTL